VCGVIAVVMALLLRDFGPYVVSMFVDHLLLRDFGPYGIFMNECDVISGFHVSAVKGFLASRDNVYKCVLGYNRCRENFKGS
jgi:hypothetical protein